MRESYRATTRFQMGTNQLIDWLFATDSVIELHTFLVTLVRHFDFSTADNGQEVKKVGAGIMVPMVVGEEHKGPQMPLKVTVLGNE